MDPEARKPAYPRLDSEGREDVDSSTADDHPGAGWGAERQVRGGRAAGSRPASSGCLCGHRGGGPVAARSGVRGPGGGPPPAPAGQLAHRSRRVPVWSQALVGGRGQRSGRRPGYLGRRPRRGSRPTQPACAPSCRPGSAPAVLVSDEVGLGVHPYSESGRQLPGRPRVGQPGRCRYRRPGAAGGRRPGARRWSGWLRRRRPPMPPPARRSEGAGRGVLSDALRRGPVARDRRPSSGSRWSAPPSDWGSAGSGGWPSGSGPIRWRRRVVVAADLAVTGMLHFDGLVDSADGLLAPMAPDRRLAVMADPGVGAFGLAVGGTVLLVRWVALSSLRPGILLVAGLWCLSRTAMAVIGPHPALRPRRKRAGPRLPASVPCTRPVGSTTPGPAGRRPLGAGLLLAAGAAGRVAGRSRAGQRGRGRDGRPGRGPAGPAPDRWLHRRRARARPGCWRRPPACSWRRPGGKPEDGTDVAPAPGRSRPVRRRVGMGRAASGRARRRGGRDRRGLAPRRAPGRHGTRSPASGGP